MIAWRVGRSGDSRYEFATMKILTVSGSLRAASSNTAVLDALPLLAPPGFEITRYLGLGELPHFNPDLDDGSTVPDPVAAFRRAVGEADGLILSSPEYAHGIAGSFKNGLDWLVGSLEFPGKPVALINAAPRASARRRRRHSKYCAPCRPAPSTTPC